jgi:phosphatidylserine/phosphatidylglycerophosphate/cardiolipin synthase-like enzyme
MPSAASSKIPVLRWHCTGREIFPGMLDAIGAAQKSIEFETYIFADGEVGRQFLHALVSAARRGVRVRVLVDAAGSWMLPDKFFSPLIAAGAEMRRFNPLHFWRFGVRDHRKLLVCDESLIFIGGFNVADEYDGDGVTVGWCDLGVCIENPALAAELVTSFGELFALADFHRKPMLRLRAFKHFRKSQKNPPENFCRSVPAAARARFKRRSITIWPRLATCRSSALIFCRRRGCAGI